MQWRKVEAIRDRIMHGAGTDEPWFLEIGGICAHYRKPLRVDEVNQMTPTIEVRKREGRP